MCYSTIQYIFWPYSILIFDFIILYRVVFKFKICVLSWDEQFPHMAFKSSKVDFILLIKPF